MADLGAIARTNRLSEFRVFPLYRVASIFDAMPDLSGTLVGSITESGTPIPNAVVHLYFRTSGVLIGRTFSAADGSYSFSGLDPTTSQYYVVALDPAGGTQYNDQIKSLLTPGS